MSVAANRWMWWSGGAGEGTRVPTVLARQGATWLSNGQEHLGAGSCVRNELAVPHGHIVDDGGNPRGDEA